MKCHVQGNKIVVECVTAISLHRQSFRQSLSYANEWATMKQQMQGKQ